jgi:hypothetical protein
MTETTTSKPARTTRVPNRFVGEGAVRQDGTLPMYVCNTCNGEVVWATSARTGRKYLVNVRRGHLDQSFYMKHDTHTCTPETTVFAVLLTEMGTTTVMALTTDETAALADFGHCVRFVEKVDLAERAVLVKIATRHPEGYLTRGFISAEGFLAEGEIVCEKV